MHLEETYIPEEYLDEIEDDIYWENDENPVFYLAVQAILHKGKEAVCYAVDIMPFEGEDDEWEEVMGALENKGYDTDGYGWESYLTDYIGHNNPGLAARVECDSESDTCGLYVLDNLEDYEALLGSISTAVRELL